MVELPPNADDGDDEGGEGGREQDDDVSGSSSTVDDRGEGRQEEGRHRKSRALVDLQVRYLKEVHAVHSRKALKKHSLREVGGWMSFVFVEGPACSCSTGNELIASGIIARTGS